MSLLFLLFDLSLVGHSLNRGLYVQRPPGREAGLCVRQSAFGVLDRGVDVVVGGTVALPLGAHQRF